MKKLHLGIIGLSEGNGHPYSWSAIFNGYNSQYMNECPFPVIPAYLAKQNFPEDSLEHLGIVTHIWCDNIAIANHVAKSSNIEFVVERLEDMVDKVDAVLLARDDAEMHAQLAMPFLKAGKALFIDKPFALSVAEANKMWEMQQFRNQIFTCSALRFAEELILTETEKEQIGTIKYVEGSVMKKWETYAIHTLEPILTQIPNRGKLVSVHPQQLGEIKQVLVTWENINAYFKTTGNIPAPLEIKFFGDKGNITKTFTNSFSAFKNSLAEFINVVRNPAKNIATEETLELVTIIEKGII